MQNYAFLYFFQNVFVIFFNLNIKSIPKRRFFKGFFYTVCPEAAMRLCEHADENSKLFCTNLSAPFICEIFGDKLMKAMQYVDYLFGNETVRKLIQTKKYQFFILILSGSKKFR